MPPWRRSVAILALFSVLKIAINNSLLTFTTSTKYNIYDFW